MDNIGKYNLISVKFAKAEQPKFEERKGQGYIQYGANNDYPDYLLNLYKESSKHGAIIKGKSNYIYGKGFNFPKDLMANTQGETFNNIFKKAVKDDELFSGYYLQIIYNLEGKIKDVYHLDFKKVRTNKEQNCFYVKNDWQDNREKARAYPAFSGTYNKDNPSQVLFVKQYNPGDEIYPTPNYYQALNYIESDVQVSRHILGNAKDGFVATTAINLNNGEPNEEQKEQVEKDIKKKFTGSEGDRVLLFFNKSKDTAAEVIPLSQTMLTKEDFTNINNLIQQEIFAGHQITSPMLFGIKTEGQLGGSSEIRDAYEIYNNTYVAERQQQHEEVFNKLLSFKGINEDYKIIPVEPLGYGLRDELLLDVMPREYFLDKLGVDQKYYTLPAVRSTGALPIIDNTTDISGNTIAPVNENLAGMSGRKFQQLERIVRKYKSGKITRLAAAMMLKNSFGISDDEVGLFLDDNSSDAQFAMEDEIDFALLEQFAQFGEDKNSFEELSRKDAIQSEYFADVEELGKPGLDIVGENPTTKTEILLRYSYDGPQDDKNRPFCAKLMELNRLYSRADIETISERLGYSVWDRRGGWFTQPDGTHRPFCRHQWFALTVTRKKGIVKPITSSLKTEVLSDVLKRTDIYTKEIGMKDRDIYVDYDATTISETRSSDQLRKVYGRPLSTKELYNKPVASMPEKINKQIRLLGKKELDSAWAIEKEKIINIKDITVIQDFVFENPLINSTNNEPISLIKYGNKYYCIDGNHRLANKYLSGAKTINAKVLNFD